MLFPTFLLFILIYYFTSISNFVFHIMFDYKFCYINIINYHIIASDLSSTSFLFLPSENGKTQITTRAYMCKYISHMTGVLHDYAKYIGPKRS